MTSVRTYRGCKKSKPPDGACTGTRTIRRAGAEPYGEGLELEVDPLLGACVTMLPLFETTSHVPPNAVTFSPLVLPGPESAMKRYSGCPL